MLTLYSIGIYFVLLVANLILASISHHSAFFVPAWHLFMLLNKLSAFAIPICMIIDIVGLF